MSKKLQPSDLVFKLKEMIAENGGRTPTRDEFVYSTVGGEYKLRKLFGSYSKLLATAGALSVKDQDRPPEEIEKLSAKYRTICSKKEQIQGFFRHVLDLDLLFKRAGNPKVLKLSAQPDTHVKFMDVPAVNSYLKFLRYYKPDIHIILGDFPDCEGLSHWPDASLVPRRIVPEMKESRELLQRIVDATPNVTTRIYCEGNHEHWIDMALGKMPELFDGLEDLGIEVNLKTLLNLKKYEYELFPLNHLVQIGNAHFTHGIYTSSHHSKKHLSTFKANVFYGHLHDDQASNETSVYGNLQAASLGCLCRLDAKFLKGRPNNWVHGHGAFEIFPDGTFIRYQIPIVGGMTSFCGEIFDGNE